MAERTLPKPDTRVRFPSPAPIIASLYGLFFLFGYCITKKAQSQYGAASFGHNRTKKDRGIIKGTSIFNFNRILRKIRLKTAFFSIYCFCSIFVRSLSMYAYTPSGREQRFLLRSKRAPGVLRIKNSVNVVLSAQIALISLNF